MLTYKLNENEKFKKAALQIKYGKNVPEFVDCSFTWRNYIMKNNLHFGHNIYINHGLYALCNALARTEKTFEEYKKNAERLLRND